MGSVGLDDDARQALDQFTSAEVRAAQEISAVAVEVHGVEDKAAAWFDVLERLTPVVGISLSTYSPVTGAPNTIAAAHYGRSMLEFLDGNYLRNDRAYRTMITENRRDFNWSTAGFDYAHSPSAVDWFRPEGFRGGSTSMLHTRAGRYVANLHISTESPDLPDRRALSFIQLVAPTMSASLEPDAWPRRLLGEFGPRTRAAFVAPDGRTLTVDETRFSEFLCPSGELIGPVNRMRGVVGDAITGPRTWLWQAGDGTWHTVHCVRFEGELLVLHEPAVPPFSLTRRELEVVALISVGATNREVARALRISERTVTRHLENTMAKTGIQNRTHLAFRAITDGFCLLTDATIPYLANRDHRWGSPPPGIDVAS